MVECFLSGQPGTSVKRMYPFSDQSKETVKDAISKKIKGPMQQRGLEMPIRQQPYSGYNPHPAVPRPSLSQPTYMQAADPQPEFSEDILNKFLGDLSQFPTLEDLNKPVSQLHSNLPPPYTTASSQWMPESLPPFSNFPGTNTNISTPSTTLFSPPLAPSNYSDTLALPNTESISSLTNASFGNINTDDILENDMKNLSIEINDIKQERRGDYPGVPNMQGSHFLAPPYPTGNPALNQSPFPLHMQSTVLPMSPADNFRQVDTPMQASPPSHLAPAYGDALPSFDLNESFSADVIDELCGQAVVGGNTQENIS